MSSSVLPVVGPLLIWTTAYCCVPSQASVICNSMVDVVYVVVGNRVLRPLGLWSSIPKCSGLVLGKMRLDWSLSGWTLEPVPLPTLAILKCVGLHGYIQCIGSVVSPALTHLWMKCEPNSFLRGYLLETHCVLTLATWYGLACRAHVYVYTIWHASLILVQYVHSNRLYVCKHPL